MQDNHTPKPPQEQSTIRIIRQLNNASIINIIEDDGLIFAYEMQEALPMRYETAKRLLDGLTAYLEQFSPQDIEDFRAEITEERQRRRALEKPTPKVKQTKSGFVYLIKRDSDYKIGVSSKPKSRITAIQTGSASPVETICLIKTDDMENLELALHNRFAEKRIRGEWFNLSTEDVEYIKSLAVQS